RTGAQRGSSTGCALRRGWHRTVPVGERRGPAQCGRAAPVGPGASGTDAGNRMPCLATGTVGAACTVARFRKRSTQPGPTVAVVHLPGLAAGTVDTVALAPPLLCRRSAAPSLVAAVVRALCPHGHGAFPPC